MQKQINKLHSIRYSHWPATKNKNKLCRPGLFSHVVPGHFLARPGSRPSHLASLPVQALWPGPTPRAPGLDCHDASAHARTHQPPIGTYPWSVVTYPTPNMHFTCIPAALSGGPADFLHPQLARSCSRCSTFGIVRNPRLQHRTTNLFPGGQRPLESTFCVVTQHTGPVQASHS